MRISIAVAVCALLLLTACGPAEDDTGSPGAESTVQDSATLDGETTTGAPPDTPVPVDDTGSADLPGLPIGGFVSFDSPDSSTCAFLAWNSETLPAGVVVRIESLSAPAGVAVDPDASCDGAPCLNADSFNADQQDCVVGLYWDGTPPSGEEEPSISASGSAFCETQEVCDAVAATAAAGGGTAFVELPVPPEPEETTESTEPTESTESTDTTDLTGESS